MPKKRLTPEISEPVEYDSEYEAYVAETQNFLETIEEFDQGNLHSALAEGLLGLRSIWDHIDRQLAAARPNDGEPAERVFSGFTEEGDYFEMYDDDKYMIGDTGGSYIGYLGFYTSVTAVATPNTSVILPDPYIGNDFMQFRFSMTPITSEAHKLAYGGSGAYPGRPYLQVGLAPGLPPEDFFFFNEGQRYFLFPTATFQDRVELHTDELRTSLFFPGKPPLHGEY